MAAAVKRSDSKLSHTPKLTYFSSVLKILRIFFYYSLFHLRSFVNRNFVLFILILAPLWNLCNMYEFLTWSTLDLDKTLSYLHEEHFLNEISNRLNWSILILMSIRSTHVFWMNYLIINRSIMIIMSIRSSLWIRQSNHSVCDLEIVPIERNRRDNITRKVRESFFIKKGSGECSDVKLNLNCGVFKTKLLWENW